MTLTLELSQELEHKLSTEASRLGLPLEQYALRLLGGEPTLKRQPKNGAEVVAHWRRKGVIGAYARESRSHKRS